MNMIVILILKYDTLIPIFLNKMYPEYFNNTT